MAHTLKTTDQNVLFGNALVEYNEQGMPLNAPYDWKAAYVATANNNDMLPIVDFELEDE